MTTTSPPPVGGGASSAPATEVELWVAGKPRGKDRPRHRPGGARPFTPKATVNAEANIAAVWREAGEPRLPEGPVRLVLDIYVERPGGHFTTKGALSATGQRMPFPSKQKPDLDNAVKLVMDALNGRAYRDDVQVVSVAVTRSWCTQAGMNIYIEALGTQEVPAA